VTVSSSVVHEVLTPVPLPTAVTTTVSVEVEPYVLVDEEETVVQSFHVS
jgi:hypothetical protein